MYLGPLVPRVMWHSHAPIAQQAERLHGKEKVCGSIPHGGSGSSPVPPRTGGICGLFRPLLDRENW